MKVKYFLTYLVDLDKLGTVKTLFRINTNKKKKTCLLKH